METPLQFIKRTDSELYEKLCEALLFARVKKLMEEYSIHVLETFDKSK